MPELNYLQLKIPVDNAELIFTALCEQYGIAEESNPDLSLEERAKKALIGVCDNAVTEMNNRIAIAQAQENKPDLGIL